jgi:hypothetical protein
MQIVAIIHKNATAGHCSAMKHTTAFGVILMSFVHDYCVLLHSNQFQSVYGLTVWHRGTRQYRQNHHI